MTRANKPSEAAVEVAIAAAFDDKGRTRIGDALAAAHDPERFEDPLDASITRREVVEMLRAEQGRRFMGGADESPADFLLRHFGGDGEAAA